VIDNLGDSSQLVIHPADELSAALGHSHLALEHLFLGLVGLEDLQLQRVFMAAGVDVGAVALDMRKEWPPGRGALWTGAFLPRQPNGP